MQQLLDSRVMIFMVTTIFFAGTGWMNLKASAQEVESLGERLDAVAESATVSESSQFIVMEDRLVRLEKAVDKLKENQQQMAFNLGAVCAATGAKCQ
jgi:septation ring formation regulator EzrA